MKTSVVRELRAVQRFPVSLPVALNWRSPGQADRPRSGFTRDISTRGMFVLAHIAPAEGEVVEFEIDLAMDESTPLVLVEGEGRVVRVEGQSTDAEHRAGFAVHNLWFKLREPEKGEAIAPELQARLAAIPRSTADRGAGNSERGGLSVVPRPLKKNRGKGGSK